MEYRFVKAANLNSLQSELTAAGLTISGLSLQGTLLTIEVSEALKKDQFDKLYLVVLNHNPVTPVVQQRVISAMDFGKSLIVDFATENIMMGLGTGDILIMLTKFATIKSMLESGSLYTALAAIQSIKPDALMTQARIDKYANKIKAYLGV